MKTISRLKTMLLVALLGWVSVANAENWSGVIGQRLYTGNTTVTLTGNVTLTGTISISDGTLTINTTGNYTITRAADFKQNMFYGNRPDNASTGGNLVINGGAYRITIDGNRAQADETDGIIYFPGSSTNPFVSSITLTNVTFQNNLGSPGEQGGCIDAGKSIISCTNCYFYDLEMATSTGHIESGAAIYLATGLSSHLSLQDCKFNNNKVSTYAGGCILVTGDASITVDNCTFTNNIGQSGGAIGVVGGGGCSITNSTFTNNSVLVNKQGSGGALMLAYTNNVIVSDCSFTGNKGEWGGGAIEIQSCNNYRLEDNTFTNNRANGSLNGRYAGFGGAVKSSYDSGDIINCTFTGNSAFSGGGALHVTDGVTRVTDCTITGNRSEAGGTGYTYPTGGGGIFIDIPHDITLRNTDVTGNTSYTTGGGIFKYGNLVFAELIHVNNNTANQGGTNVYIPRDPATGDPYQAYTRIHKDGLLCGSLIGITKTTADHTYETDDVFGGVRTDIVRGTQANCDYAFRNRFFFDDTDTYHVHNLVQGSTNPYANAKLYFITSWYSYVPSATVNVDYKADANGFVTEVMTAKGLAYFAWHVNQGSDGNGNTYQGKTVKQTADIDLTAYYWEPIGIKEYGDCSTAYHPFKGTYDGQGYVIRNVRSILPYDALGLFGYVDGGTITRTFVESGTLEATGSRTVGIGGLVGRLLNGATVTYSEARVTLKKTATATMGGLIGLTGGTASNIHSSMAMSEMTNNGTTGGLVGQLTAGSTLKNSFSNAKYTLTGTPYAGGIVGDNAGIVANCYANDTRSANSIASTVNFGWLAGQNTGTFQYCYAPNSTYNYTAATGGTNTEPGHFTAAESLNGKYKYNQYDQKVTDGGTTHKPTEGKINLLGYLNHWVSGDFATWTRTLSSPINTDYPVPMLPTFACAGSTDGIFIWYSPTLDAMTTRYNALDGGDIYLYTAQENVGVNNDSDVDIYIGEDIGITQTAANTLQSTHVGITFDNSDGSNLGGQNYDWHMFATPLSNASMGLTYSAEYLGVDNSTWGNDGVYPVDPPAGSVIIGTNSYFPTDTPYGPPYTQINADGGGYDFYCFSEPYYHWVNFKRHSGDHWHQDSQDHVHSSLPYGDYNASGTWTNGNETVMIPAKGYIMAVDKETTLINNGTLNNGIVSRKITRSNDLPDYAERLSGCNLIGNPYQSYLNFDAFAGTNGIDTYYILDADEHEYVAYTVGQTEVYTGDDMTVPCFIHPHQGFFVKTAVDKTLTFDNTMRSARGKGNSYFRDEERPVYPLVTLTVADANEQRDYVTIELDRPEQGGGEKAKGLHTGNGIIYCHLGDVDYHVAFTESGTESLPVRFEAFEDDVFTLRWNTMNADFSYLHLIDNLTGSDVDCLSSSEYHFEGRTTDYASRFQLLFEFTGVEENEDRPSTNSETFAFFMNDELIVNGEGILHLFDLNGRLLMSKRIEGTQSSLGLVRLNPGVYVLQLVNGKTSRTQKLVINK